MNDYWQIAWFASLNILLVLVLGLYVLFDTAARKSANSIAEVESNSASAGLFDQEAFKNSLWREIITMHFVRLWLMVIATVLFAYSCGQPSSLSVAVAMLCVCLATWHFYQYRALKVFLIEKGVPVSHVVWNRSVWSGIDVDMKKNDREVGRQISEIEKKGK